MVSMIAWRRISLVVMALCALAYFGTARAAAGADGCVNNSAQCTKQNDPQGQQPKTLQTIEVTAPAPIPIGIISYGGANGGSPHLRQSNNYSVTTNNAKDRSNHNCKDVVTDPIEVSTTSKIESLVLFQLPGEMGLRYELDYTSIGGWHC